FDPSPVLTYLQLETDSQPSPSDAPVDFLKKYIRQLPPELLRTFTPIITPKQRTVIPNIRNRRYKYTLSSPGEFKFDEARKRWPTLWRGARDRREQQQEAADERQWAERNFLDGQKQHIGKLGSLLGDYAEEREGERLRELRRAHAERQPDFMPEEEDSDESEFEEELAKTQAMPESPEEAQEHFERLVRERFIYGLLDPMDYDAIDWNDEWEAGGTQEDEDRWFDAEEENETEDKDQSTGEYDY
ncbi:hypothetical protein SCHPADRAFT_790257, partial [Schizopora paradoxa]